jgi:hypothetical protein
MRLAGGDGEGKFLDGGRRHADVGARDHVTKPTRKSTLSNRGLQQMA